MNIFSSTTTEILPGIGTRLLLQYMLPDTLHIFGFPIFIIGLTDGNSVVGFNGIHEFERYFESTDFDLDLSDVENFDSLSNKNDKYI